MPHLHDGYVWIKPPLEYPGKRYGKRYAPEHHYVWWLNTGEVVEPPWEVHHRNENRSDNSFDNLVKLTKSAHMRMHMGGFPDHGKISRYSRYGCRCDDCKAAWSVHQKRIRARRKSIPVQHQGDAPRC